MSTPIFPVLSGQSFGVKKKPTMSTIVANHVSGREVRTALYQNPIWQFEMAFDGLDGSLNGQYPGLGAQSMQSLLGLFLQCGGQFGTFIYYDPTDFQALHQSFGAGNGTTTSFQLLRTLGGYSEEVVAPFTASAPTLFPLPGATTYAPNNLLANSDLGSSAGLTLYNMTTSGGQTDPFGGSLAVMIAETTANNSHFTFDVATVPPGVPLTFSIYLKAGGATKAQLYLQRAASPYESIYVDFDLATGASTLQGAQLGGTGAIVATMTPAGGGWYRSSVSGMPASNLASVNVGVAGVNNYPLATLQLSYPGATSNTIYAAFPQLETVSAPNAPGPYQPTLATPYYGGPSISVAGAYVDPTTYSITNGLVTFTSAPAPGAALQWSGYFGFLCRFDADALDFDQFMSNLWQVESLKFCSVRAQ
jgi:hypothetical protein